MTTRANVGSALLALRTSKNLTITQLSDVLKISSTAYSSYERGYTLPDVKVLLQVSTFYQINIEFLLFLLCIDAASVAQIETADLFQSFTYGFYFPWKFFEMHGRYERLPESYKTAVRTFVEAAERCHLQSVE